MYHHIKMAVLPVLAGLVSLAQAEPLSFSRALDLAEHRSPVLTADTDQIDAARSAAIPAGSLPDPKIFVGIDNFPVSGPDAGRLQSDFMTMQKIGVMQDVPNADKRHAREAVAAASVNVADAQLQVARLGVRRDAARAWLDLYYLRRKDALFDELNRENAVLTAAVRAQVASGRAQAADAVAPQQELTQIADRRDDLARDITKAKARLRQLVGGDADQGLAGAPPALLVDAPQLRAHLRHHPELLAFAAATLEAEAQVREAQAMKKSDWGVELAYQRRAPQFGNMVSIQFNFDLPVSTATRQDPVIAAKELELARIDAERDGLLRQHERELDSTLADYDALTRQLERAEHTALPLAEQKVALQTASYRAGRADIGTVLAARRERIDERMRIIDLKAQRAAAWAQLRFNYEENEQ